MEYKKLIEDLESLAKGHEKDGSKYTANMIREAIQAIKSLSSQYEDDLK